MLFAKLAYSVSIDCKKVVYSLPQPPVVKPTSGGSPGFEVRMYACIYTHTYAYTYTQTHRIPSVRVYTHIYTYTHAHVHTHTYIYTHIHMHTYTHIECLTNKQTNKQTT